MTDLMIPPPLTLDIDEVDYPDTDGEPMAESDRQRDWMLFLIKVLQIYYAEQPNVYVSGSLLIYYVEGDKRFSIVPDVFVVFGIAKETRDTYLLWKEGKGPDIVIEITSKTTRKRDQKEKPALYRDMGVQEYFQYDPAGDYLFPALQGLRLDAEGTYVPIAPRTQNGLLVLESKVLDLELHLDKLRLRVYDPASQSYLRSHEEERETRIRAEARAQAADARAQAEAEARRQAEEQMKAMEAELRRLRERAD